MRIAAIARQPYAWLITLAMLTVFAAEATGHTGAGRVALVVEFVSIGVDVATRGPEEER